MLLFQCIPLFIENIDLQTRVLCDMPPPMDFQGLPRWRLVFVHSLPLLLVRHSCYSHADPARPDDLPPRS